MDLILSRDEEGYIVQWGGQIFPCSIGRGGIVEDKVEGDGGTPVGRFPFRKVYFRPDRVTRPQTSLPLSEISQNDGWCDDPAHVDYNTPVTLPHPARHEVLWRKDHAYDLIIVIGHNDAPVVPGKGSAVFVHVRQPTGTATEGCVALSRENLLEILYECTFESHLVVNVKAL